MGLTSAELVDKIHTLCMEDPHRTRLQVVVRDPQGNLYTLNNVIYQAEADELQLFVAKL